MRVIAFPKKEIPVSICAHRYGAKSTLCLNSDTAQVNNNICEMMSFRHNIAISSFVNPYNSPTADIKGIAQTGRVKFDLYFPTDRWASPRSGIVEMIPDYISNVWTSAGAEAFGVTAGTAKPARYPNHGQQMFDASNGQYGWDSVSGKYGASDGKELYKMVDILQDYFRFNIGAESSGFSYRNGRTEGAEMLVPKFLGGRNSNIMQSSLDDKAVTDYGAGLGFPSGESVSRLDRISMASSTRYKDMYENLGLGSQSQVLEYIKRQLRDTINNGGFYNDFIHRYQWGATPAIENFNQFLISVNEVVGDHFVHYCGYGEAMEYLFYREMIADISAYEDSGVVKVVIQKSDKFKDLEINRISQTTLLHLLRTPISIEIDLSETSLKGVEVSANVGSLISNGGDKYVVNIPFGSNLFDGFGCLEIFKGSADYLDFSIPVGELSREGNILFALAGKPCRAVLFVGEKDSPDWGYYVVARSNSLCLLHEFDISEYSEGFDFRVGFISSCLRSVLI